MQPFPSLPPYEVPEQDKDLLEAGATLTREALADRGFLPCSQCGEMSQPGWGPALGFCSRHCRDSFNTEALRTRVREATHTPTALHWIEKGMLEIALSNRFYQLGRAIDVVVDPSQGFEVTPEGGGRFVGAREAKLDYQYMFRQTDEEREANLNLLRMFMADTVATPTGDLKALPRRIPAEAASEEQLHWVWRLRVFQGKTLAEAGRAIGKSKERARQLCALAESLGRREALKHVPPIPRPEVLRPIEPPLPEPVWAPTTLTSVEARRIARDYCRLLCARLGRLPLGVTIQLANGKVQGGTASYHSVYASHASIHTPDGLSREEAALAVELLKTIWSSRLRENPKDAHLTQVEHYERLRDPETD